VYFLIVTFLTTKLIRYATMWDGTERRALMGPYAFNYQHILESLLSCQSTVNFTCRAGIQTVLT